MGSSNEDVYGHDLHMSDAEIEELKEEKII